MVLSLLQPPGARRKSFFCRRVRFIPKNRLGLPSCSVGRGQRQPDVLRNVALSASLVAGAKLVKISALRLTIFVDQAISMARHSSPFSPPFATSETSGS